MCESIKQKFYINFGYLKTTIQKKSLEKVPKSLSECSKVYSNFVTRISEKLFNLA